LAALLFGSATPLSKLLLEDGNPFILAGLLYLGAGIALAPKALRGGIFAKLRHLNGKNRLYVLGSILGGGLLAPVLLLFGLRLARSASVSLWLNLELVATAVLGTLFFKDRMTRHSLVAVLGILAASVLLSLGGGAANIGAGLFVAGACLLWGFDNHCTALIDQLQPAESTFLKGLAAGSANLLFGLLASGWHLPSPIFLGSALAIGAFSYGASIVLYISAAQGLGATRAQLFFSSSPVFGMALAALVLRESFTLPQVAAFTLMVASYAVLFSERHAHAHAHPEAVHTHWHRHADGHHAHGDAAASAGKVHDLLTALFGHSHAHRHEHSEHEHPHVSDIHHRHTHAAG
jgi:drug/metabolite transporter (DMT)-like permease